MKSGENSEMLKRTEEPVLPKQETRQKKDETLNLIPNLERTGSKQELPTTIENPEYIPRLRLYNTSI